jgi:hypothetical protein
LLTRLKQINEKRLAMSTRARSLPLSLGCAFKGDPTLSHPEAAKFWPNYKHYADDLHEVNNAKYALLKQYAEMWSTMTDQDARIYVRRWMEVDEEAQALRLKYVPVATQVLPGKKAATFFQLERKLCMMVDLQLFSQIPPGACEGVRKNYSIYARLML